MRGFILCSPIVRSQRRCRRKTICVNPRISASIIGLMQCNQTASSFPVPGLRLFRWILIESKDSVCVGSALIAGHLTIGYGGDCISARKLETPARSAKKRAQPDLLRPLVYFKARKLPPIAPGTSVVPTSATTTIPVRHRFCLIHGQRASL
jgi:hypothetical protein